MSRSIVARVRTTSLLTCATVTAVLSGLLAAAPATAAPQQAGPVDAQVTLTRTTSVTEAGNSAAQATIGETITYTLTTTIPASTTVYTGVVTDQLGTRMSLVPGSLCVAGCTLDGAPFGGVTESPANTVRAPLPTTYDAPVATDGVLVLTFQAKVLDVAANYRGQGLGNGATLAYTDEDGAPWSRSGSVSTAIVEPSLTAGATTTGGAVVAAAETKVFTVSASNSSSANVSTAHDLVVVNTLPAGTEPVTINDGGTWNAGTRTVTWTLPTLAPGATKAFTYTVQVESPPTGGSTYTNTVLATSTSLSAGTGGARTPASNASTAGDYDATAQRTLSVVLPTVSNSIDRPTATVGSAITWTIGVTVPANVRYLDATVTDAIPDGLAFDAYGTVTCTNCPGTDPAVSTFPVTTSGVTQQAAWFLGDLGPAAGQRVYTLVLKGHVLATRRAGGAVAAPVTFTGEARVRTNRTDVMPASPATVPAAYSDTVGPASASVAVREPKLAIDKSVDKGPKVEGGDVVTYTVAVTNTAGWPAYDVQVTDQPDAGLVDVTLAAGATLSTDGWTADDPAMHWVIPGPLAAGATQVLTYTAKVKPGAQLTAGDQVTNVATVSSYFGAPGAERADAPSNPWRAYAGPSDVVSLTVAKPLLTIATTTDGGEATAGTDTTFTIDVTNADTFATAHGVVADVVLPAGLTYVSSSAGGTASGQTVSWNVGALAPGASVTRTVVAHVGADVAPGTTLTTTGSTRADETTADVIDTGSVTVGTSTDLVLTQTASEPSVVAGEELVYTLTTRNDGPSAARTTTLTDTLPSYLTLVELDDPTHCSVTGQTITCSYGDLAPDATRSVDLTVRVASARQAPVINIAGVTSSTTELVPADNTATTTTDVTAIFTTGPAAGITGDPVFGGVLTATPGPAQTGTTTPAADSFTYQWFADGTELADATGATLAVTSSMIGRSISVAVSAHRAATVDATDESEPTAAVTEASFTTGPTALVDGIPIVGATLTAGPTAPGATTPAAESYSYQWLADGEPVTDATSTTLVLSPALAGVRVSVVVTAHRAWHVDAVSESAATAPVALAAFTTRPTATIIGTAQVGQTLTARAGAVTPTPTATTFAWYADGTPIAGATSSELALTSARRGQRISMTATVTRPGYDTVSSTSAATAPVATDRAPGLQLTLKVPPRAQEAETPDGDATALRGRRVRLTWSATDALALSASGELRTVLEERYGDQPVPMSGSVLISLDRAGGHTFRMRAINEAGSTSARAAIVAVREPTDLRLDAPTTTRAGRPFLLTVAGLGAKERFYVTIRHGGRTTRVLTGRAGARGEVVGTIRPPARFKRGTTIHLRVTGRATQRSGDVLIRLR